MTINISILGVPYSGKSSILQKYSNNVVDIGRYARSLENNSQLRKEYNYYTNNTLPLPPELTLRLISDFDLEGKEFLLFDGTPRTIEQYKFLSNKIDFKHSIEICVENKIWRERLDNASNTRIERINSDSSISKILKRTDTYLQEKKELTNLFDTWYSIDNSGSIKDTLKEFDRILEEIKNGRHN